MSQAGRALPSAPQLARGLASRGRIQFHIRTPGCAPSAPLRNPRWRLLEGPVGSMLAAGLPPSLPTTSGLPDRGSSMRAANGARY